MRKTKTPKLEWHFINNKDSERKLEVTYRRIFEIACNNILEKGQKKKKLLQNIKTGFNYY